MNVNILSYAFKSFIWVAIRNYDTLYWIFDILNINKIIIVNWVSGDYLDCLEDFHPLLLCFHTSSHILVNTQKACTGFETSPNQSLL